MARWISALRRHKKAAASLEFAVIMPAILLLELGVIECGRLIWTAEALQESAAAGSRCMGVLQPSCTNGGAYSSTATVSAIQAIAGGWGVLLPASAIVPNASTSCGTATGFSTVTISYTFQTLLPNLLIPFSGGLNLNIAACFPNQPP
jgi:Flp pilus assembly protein TadG